MNADTYDSKEELEEPSFLFPFAVAHLMYVFLFCFYEFPNPIQVLVDIFCDNDDADQVLTPFFSAQTVDLNMDPSAAGIAIE